MLQYPAHPVPVAGTCQHQIITAAAPPPRSVVVQSAPSKPAPAVAANASPAGPPPVRLPKPHEFFPFDLFDGEAAEGYLSEFLTNELGYVKDHCMVPPYPWGQVIYYNLLVDHVLPSVSGHMAEFGIGQGGTSVFLARLAKKYGRKFLAVDSFEGLPPPDKGKDNHYFLQGDYKSSEGVDNYNAFMQYKSAFDVEDNMHVIKGFFRDVDIPDEFAELAFVHLDSDLYDSVYDSLEMVWDRIAPGGCIAVDDFFHHAQGPARAVSDFFRIRLGEEQPPPLLFVVPTYAVIILKGRSACMEKEWLDANARGKAPQMYAPRALDGNYYCFVLMRQCEPFKKAAEASARRAREAYEHAVREGRSADGLLRVKTNAEQFLAFLHYPDSAPRSGNDIMRYLMPLEDLFDFTQGSLCGMPGEARKNIEIRI